MTQVTGLGQCMGAIYNECFELSIGNHGRVVQADARRDTHRLHDSGLAEKFWNARGAFLAANDSVCCSCGRLCCWMCPGAGGVHLLSRNWKTKKWILANVQMEKLLELVALLQKF